MGVLYGEWETHAKDIGFQSLQVRSVTTSGLSCDALRAKEQLLRVAFISGRIETALIFNALGTVDRELGLDESAKRCFALAHLCYRRALQSLQTGHLDTPQADELRKRIETLGQQLGAVDHRSPNEVLAAAATSVPVRAPAPEPLTKREKEVLVLIGEGLSTKQIAARLGITFKTAACHRDRIMNKLGVRNAAMLVRSAIRMGLLQP